MPGGVALDAAKKNLERELKRGERIPTTALGSLNGHWETTGEGQEGGSDRGLIGAVFQHQSLTSWRAMRRRDSSRKVFR
jgi:hypothetical protein